MASFFKKKSLKSPDNVKRTNPVLRWVGRFFMMLGAVMFIFLILSIISILSLFGGREKMAALPDSFILAHTLNGSLPEVNTLSPLLAQFFPPQLTLYSFLRSVEIAKDDERVQSLVVRINDGDYSMTQIQTLRTAILDFKSSGKKTYAYSDSFGGFSNGMGEYWLASAFDEIWVQPVGTVSLNGIRVEQPFFKNGLDKVGVEMEMEARKSYKTGPEMYLRNEMSGENRETIVAIVDDVMERMTGDMMSSRQIAENRLKVAIDNSPLTVEEAKNFGLIDKIGYVDELEDILIADKDKDREGLFVGFDRYKYVADKRVHYDGDLAKVALVNVDGAIMDVDAMASTNHPMAFMMPDNIADAKIISSAILDAANDNTIEVIILRVNSPGGSPTASEKIRRAVVKAKEKGKYVIVSMADVAASGGYWISVDADHIIASDLTLTGSIGVYGGKPNLSGLWDKLGVSWGAVEYGQNASMWTSNTGMNATERKRLNVMMDSTYVAFTDRVATGRNMSTADVEKSAQGRAWTGVDAIKYNLVDEIGGYETALHYAAKRTGHENWKSMRMVVLPHHEDSLRDITKLFGLPSIAELPKLPNAFVPAIYNDAIVTAPQMRVDF